MANNWEGLDELNANLIPRLREAMEIVASNGEYWVKQGHQEWNNDTRSLIASVTGYEATIGDPFKNFNNVEWLFAQQFGSLKYNNLPEHYDPVEGEELEVDPDTPTAIVTVWTKYPNTFGGGGSANIILGEEVDATLMGALDQMASEVEGQVGNLFGASRPK